MAEKNRTYTRRSKKKEKKVQDVKIIKDPTNVELIQTKYSTTTGEGGVFAVLCSECKQVFVPNGTQVRNKAAEVQEGSDTGVFLCSNCS